MKVSNRTRLAIIFKLFLLIIFLILCFVIKQNVEYMLPEVVEYAVLDSSNVISFSEASIKKKSTAIFDKSVVVKDIDFNEVYIFTSMIYFILLNIPKHG